METKKRFRPTLAQYRKIERDLLVSNGHIELGTKQLSDLQRKHDIQEAANKELKESYDIAKVNLDIACDGIKFYKEAIDTNNKDLCKALELKQAYKQNGDRAIRLNWYLLALIVALNICLIWR